MSAALQVVQDPAAAESLLKPDRLRILERLAQPDSAAGVAKRLEMPRQTVNYHLRELEKAGLVEFVENRMKGNCRERVLRAAARSYLISPAALGSLGVSASEARDRFSSAYLVSAAARLIHEVAFARQRAAEASKSIATLSLETSIRFSSAQARHAFAEDLANAVAQLATKYHDPKAPGGRTFRLMAGCWPAVTPSAPASTQPVNLE